MENIFLFIIAIVVIIFIWMLWLRHSITRDFLLAENIKNLLIEKLNKRRDSIPYLLESYKLEREPDDLWRKILAERSAFHEENNLEKEWELEKTMESFFNSAVGMKNLNFLEAKKDILDLGELIGEIKEEFYSKLEKYNQKRKHFPYSIVNEIFY